MTWTTTKEHGFGVAQDDLGSGHSTLQLLGVLRPNYVKLEMELVRDVHKDAFKRNLVRQIIELAHRFDIKVVAEGIEVYAEAAWLQSQGVDYMQGYYCAKPAAEPIGSTTKLLTPNRTFRLRDPDVALQKLCCLFFGLTYPPC